MAQTRAHKIGTVYSRVRNLLEKKALKDTFKPVWYDIYEAFPPKYEPRYDRHLIPKIVGGTNSAKMPDPPKILYKEDVIRAKYYKAFLPSHREESSSFGGGMARSEVFDLTAISTRTLSQVFIEKYEKLQSEGLISKNELFLATTEALEKDGINLRQPMDRPFKEVEKERREQRKPIPSIKDMFDNEPEEKLFSMEDLEKDEVNFRQHSIDKPMKERKPMDIPSIKDIFEDEVEDDKMEDLEKDEINLGQHLDKPMEERKTINVLSIKDDFEDDKK